MAVKTVFVCDICGTGVTRERASDGMSPPPGPPTGWIDISATQHVAITLPGITLSGLDAADFPPPPSFNAGASIGLLVCPACFGPEEIHAALVQRLKIAVMSETAKYGPPTAQVD